MVNALSSGHPSFYDQALTCVRSHNTAIEARGQGATGRRNHVRLSRLFWYPSSGKNTTVVYTRIVDTRRIKKKNPRERRALLQQSKTTTSPLSIKVIPALQSAAVEDVLYRGMHISACRKQCTHILSGVGKSHIL